MRLILSLYRLVGGFFYSLNVWAKRRVYASGGGGFLPERIWACCYV